MTLEEANQALRNFGKPAKAEPQAVHPLMLKARISALKNRAADIRKSVANAFEQARKLKATHVAAQIHALSAKLAAMEVELAKIK